MRMSKTFTFAPNRFVIWTTLVCIFLPYSIAVYVGDLKFTPGKLAALLFLAPAVATFVGQLSRGRRHLVASDIFAIAASLWMVAAPVAVAGTTVLVTMLSMVIEFFGMYTIARAYFFGEPAFQEFCRALTAILVAIIALAALDTLSGRFFINETMAQLFSVVDARSLRGDEHFRREIFGFYVIRASSTLDHPILLGAFCAIVSAVILYVERDMSRRIAYLLVCAVGCVLSVSSAPMLGMLIAISVRSYHSLLAKAPWRWKALFASSVLLLAAIFASTRDPIGWIISHLTLDEQTGYYRLLIWQSAFARIDQSPWLGSPLGSPGDEILENSVDSVWLVAGLTFGIPLIVLLLLTNLGALSSPERAVGQGDLTYRLSTAMSLVIALFIFIGLTVHYWNAMWLFWGLCIGIRASLSEYSKLLRQSSSQPLQSGVAASPIVNQRFRLGTVNRYGRTTG